MTDDVISFVDTNVIVYAHDRSDARKQAVAQRILEGLWADRSGCLSTQVLQELYVVVTSKQKLALSPADGRALVEVYAEWPLVAIEPTLIMTASRLAEERGLPFWDALVIEAARVAGADRLLTEDLQDGHVFDAVRVENPFAER